MRIIKLGLISFIVLFGIVTLISLLFPSHIRLSKATNLPNRRDSIFALLNNDASWHPAYTDTSMKAARIQKKLLWQTDSTLVYQLQQGSKKAVTSGYELYGGPSSDSLTLQWYMDFQLSWYPWEKFSSLFYERTYGVMMEQGLLNLKKQLIK
jgi:hypothetical protein